VYTNSELNIRIISLILSAILKKYIYLLLSYLILKSAKFSKDLVIVSLGSMNAVGFASPRMMNGCSCCVRSCPLPYVITVVRTNLKISICRHDKFQR
jgi:hypothetical protein